VRPKYIKRSSFTAVFTPHFLEALICRNRYLPGNTSIESMLERMWEVGIEDRCTGFSFGEGYLYYKCKWNNRRDRWELELISFTPNKQFHTSALQYAIEVIP
jgi:hypothetical protein